MARRRIIYGSSVVILALTVCAHSLAVGDDFGMIVQNIERHYRAKKKKIPLLGLAGFAVKIIQPAGVKGFKLAVFENQDFAPGERDRTFELAVSGSLNSKWKPMVRSNSRSSGDRSFVFTHQSGKDIELLTVTFTSRQAIVAQAKVNPEAMARFMQKPELLGSSLAGSFNGAGSISNSSSGAHASSDSSLDAIRDRDAAVIAPTSGSEPKLKTRADNDSEFNPIARENLPISASSREEVDVHLEARLINLNVKAMNRGGASLSDLKKDDFKIFEDGIEQSIFYFEPVSAPINVVLLLDLSGSTRERRKVMIETAKRFIDSLGAEDRIAIAAFTRDFVVVSDFTADRGRLKKAVENTKKIQGGTAFYDAMWSTLDLLRRLKDSRKAIVVLTDGVDNSLVESGHEPSNHSFEELLGRVREDDATIYPIYFNPEEARLLRLVNDPSHPTDWRDRIQRRLKPNLTAHRQLESLAEESAGMIFVAEGEQELDGVYQRVAAELRLIYTLAYAPKNSLRDGSYRKIRVDVNREDAVLKTRRGYLAK